MDAEASQLYSAIVIALIIIGGIISYFIISIVQHQKSIVQLQRENVKAEITALEKDRSRIAADIHDDLAPMLVSIKMRISSFDITNDSDKEQLQKTNDNIDDIAKRLRAISFDLMPSSLQSKGIVGALTEFINSINRGNKIYVRLHISNDLQIPEEISIHIYRIIQETIHNTLKHANATEMTIALNASANKLVITTQDNGVGYDYDEVMKKNSGLGLRSIFNRINILKGEYYIDSKLGTGTDYTFEIPL